MFCVVPKCTLDYKKCNGIGYQYFPKERTMARKWCEAINRPELMKMPRKDLVKLYICGKHFEVSQLNKKTKKIKAREIPTINIEPSKAPVCIQNNNTDTKTEPPDTVHDFVIKTEPLDTVHDVVIKTEPPDTFGNVVIKTESPDTVGNPFFLQTYNINATGCSELQTEGEWYILPEADIKIDPELVTPMDPSSAEAVTDIYCYDVFEYIDNNYIEDVNQYDQPLDLSIPRSLINNSVLVPEISVNTDHVVHEISNDNSKGM